MPFKILALALVMGFSSLAFSKTVSFACVQDGRYTKVALVAGKTFQLHLEEGIGLNANFDSPIVAESTYLGRCVGQGKENLNPLAEGWAGTAEMTGSSCAADGFSIYFDAGMAERKEALVQINESPEDVLYRCYRYEVRR